MTAVLVGRFEVGSPEWNAARDGGLGGSEVAPLLGLSPYESRFSLWHRKAGLIGPVEESEIMEAGKLLEPAIMAKFEKNHPELRVGRAATFAHHERPWQIANPDGLVFTDPQRFYRVEHTWQPDALVELKYALYDDEWGEPGSDEIPIWYRCQIQWYLDVFGLDVCYLMVFIGSQGSFREYVIRADAGEQQILRDAAEQFLADLINDVRPDLDAHSATYSAVREMHPDIDPITVELSTATAVAFCKSKAAVKAAQSAALEATSRVADEMGTAKTATYLGVKIATRQTRGEGDPHVVAARKLPDFTELKEAS